MATITHALAKAGGKRALCGARKNLILGGAFEGAARKGREPVTCIKCLKLHQKIIGKRPRMPKESKLTNWFVLGQLINAYIEAAIEDSWKGGGDPNDYDVKELRLKLARMELSNHMANMERELS